MTYSKTKSQYAEFSHNKTNNVIAFENLNKNPDIEDGELDMDENKLLEKYLDKVDQDRRDQDTRISKNIELMEKRITEERRLSEERMESRFNKTMDKIDKLESRIDKLESRIDSKIDNSNKWVIGTCIATIIGIATIVITVLVSK